MRYSREFGEPHLGLYPYPKLPAPRVTTPETPGKCEVEGCFVCTGRLRENARVLAGGGEFGRMTGAERNG